MRRADFYPLVATEEELTLTYYARETGLTGIIVSAVPRGKRILEQPYVRIAIGLGSNDFDAAVTISDYPNILEGALPPSVGRRVFTFIQRNRDVLQALWNEAISAEEAAQSFRRGLKG